MRRYNSWIWRRISWPRPFTPEQGLELLDRLAADQSLGVLVFEARSAGGQIHYLVGNRPGHTRAVTLVLSHLIPGVRFQEANTTHRPLSGHAGYLHVSHNGLALNVDRVTAITRAVLAGLATATEDGDALVLQVVLGGRLSPRFVPGHPISPTESWFDLLIHGNQPATTEAKASMKTRASLHGFKATIRIGAVTQSPGRARTLITNVLGGLRVTEAAGVRIHFTLEHPHKLDTGTEPWRWPLQLSSRELVPLMGWPLDPSSEAQLPGHPSPHPRPLPAPETLKPSARAFAETTAPGEPVRFGIAPGDSLQHTLLLGPTASGKSTVMLAMIMEAINAGRGVLVIDPKTDLVNDVLARIPDNRTKDVVVIDPTSHRPVGFNPMNGAGRDTGLVADAMLAVFRELSGEAWGPRTQEVLSAALMTLAHLPGATLPMLPSLLTDPQFRRRALGHVDDPLGIGSFWAGYEAMSPQQQAQVIAPAMTRLRQFLMRPGLRAVLGQADPAFELRDLFSKHRIVLVSLNKGLLGAESARLLGSLIVGQLWPLILSRVSLPPERRQVVNVFIDEVQDYVAAYSDLDDALSQARGLGVGFTIAHQYRKQLPAVTRAGVDANARNKIIFGLNGEDATEIARQAPGLDPTDFMLLPRFGIYTNLIVDGHTTGWFSARTLPKDPTLRAPLDLRAQSANTYGREATDVENDLYTALGIDHSTGTKQGAGQGSDEPIGRRHTRTGGTR